jgi:transcription initiation factor TFIIIB Brf1 subunit/transcription initiation factor TFIIB
MESPEELDDIWNDFFTSSVNITEKECKPFSNKCKNCNKESLLTIEGDITCVECGFVNESHIISDDPEWNNYSENGVMNSSGMRAGNVLDITNPYDTGGEFLPKYHWSWHLDDQGNKRYTNLSKIAIRTSYTSKQRAFDEAKYSFEKIQEMLGLSEGIFNTAKLFWGILLKTDILKRGGNRRGMKACCVFYACISEKQQRNREDISHAFDIDHSADFTKGEKIFREIFEKNEHYSWVLFKGSENESMYNRYVAQLGLPFKVNKLMNRVKKDTQQHLLGIAAKSEIAGILYFVCKEILNLKHPNKSEIAKCIGICNPTLNKVIEILKYFYTQNPELKSTIINLIN